jgi:hypothetical protein
MCNNAYRWALRGEGAGAPPPWYEYPLAVSLRRADALHDEAARRCARRQGVATASCFESNDWLLKSSGRIWAHCRSYSFTLYHEILRVERWRLSAPSKLICLALQQFSHTQVHPSRSTHPGPPIEAHAFIPPGRCRNRAGTATARRFRPSACRTTIRTPSCTPTSTTWMPPLVRALEGRCKSQARPQGTAASLLDVLACFPGTHK